MTNELRNHPREIKLTKNINPYCHGSVLAEFGNTKIHITASVSEETPRWMRDSTKGWVTAEYSMLPGSTHSRNNRERKGVSGRSQEIQRLIARSLRAAIDLEKLGPRLITVDCDVLVADGGTRTTSISGGYVALKLAIDKLIQNGELKENPIINQIGAISVGIGKNGEILGDLNYEEDSSCHTDMNIVMTSERKFVEVQGTAEGEVFDLNQLNQLISCAGDCLETVFKKQNEVLS